jgi:hypothetical protein
MNAVNQAKFLDTNEGYCVIIGVSILVVSSDMEKYCEAEKVQLEGSL